MSRCPYTIKLTDSDREYLKNLSKCRTAQAQTVDRSRILLQKEKGVTDYAIAKGLNISITTVRFCIAKYLKGGINAALFDEPRKGRPAEITVDAVTWIMEVACHCPTDFGYSQEIWNLKDLHQHIQKHAEEAGYPRLKSITKARIQQLLKLSDTGNFKLKHYSHRNDCTEQDYYKLAKNACAELINGKIYNQNVPGKVHEEILSYLKAVITDYIKRKRNSYEIYPAPYAVHLFNGRKNIVVPDISVICDQNKLTENGFTGAPDWIIEIVSEDNPSHDYVLKLHLYMEADVHEYWIVNPINNSIYVYFLEKNYFETKAYTFQDTVKANICDDLWIDFQLLKTKCNIENL